MQCVIKSLNRRGFVEILYIYAFFSNVNIDGIVLLCTDWKNWHKVGSSQIYYMMFIPKSEYFWKGFEKRWGPINDGREGKNYFQNTLYL